jgi:hypothetical protein
MDLFVKNNFAPPDFAMHHSHIAHPHLIKNRILTIYGNHGYFSRLMEKAKDYWADSIQCSFIWSDKNSTGSPIEEIL